jgi:hypothetical protein
LLYIIYEGDKVAPHPPFIILLLGIKVSPHPPRITRRVLRFLVFLRIVLRFRLRVVEKGFKKERKLVNTIIIYINILL